MEKIEKLKRIFKNENIDGYIIPKNDEFFGEYAFPDRLKTVSNFSGSDPSLIFSINGEIFLHGPHQDAVQ